MDSEKIEKLHKMVLTVRMAKCQFFQQDISFTKILKNPKIQEKLSIDHIKVHYLFSSLGNF